MRIKPTRREHSHNSGELSLAELTRKLRNASMERVVASFGENRVAPLRALVLGIVVLWVLGWRELGHQPVLVQEAHAVYGWALGSFIASVIWWLCIRTHLLRIRPWLGVAGMVGNFAIISVLTKHAFLLLITLEAVLPFLAIVIGARYSWRWFKAGVASSLLILLWSAPSGYWLSRPAYLVYAVVLTVGLPLLIGRILSALREVSHQALNALDAQNRFVGAMSHELRTPLNVIINSIGLIDRDGLSDDQLALLQQSEINAKALSHRVNNVLDIAKHSAGRIELSRERIDLRDLMDTVRSVNTSAAIEQGIDFSVVVDPEVPEALCGDQGRVEQVLSNLATNAIKYTPRGGQVNVHLSARYVLETKMVELVCAVTDTGVGIADIDKARIFDAFYQVSNGDARLHEGVGLGLFIVRNVTEQMGGSLTVQDNAGGGTVFTWRVRLPPAEHNEPTPRLVPIKDLMRMHRVGVAPKRCLVIDDNAANLDILRRLLEGAGHSVTVACDGAAGLASLAESQVDLAFLDLHMPGLSGWDVLDAQKQGPSSLNVPIVVLSAESDPEVMQEALLRGAVAILSKPVVAQRLFGVIEDIAATWSNSGADASATTPLAQLRELDLDAALDLLRHVYNGLQNAKQQLRDAQRTGSASAFSEGLHGLRNELGNIGFSSSSRLVVELEAEIKASGPPFPMAIIDVEIEKALNWIMMQLNQEMASAIDRPADVLLLAQNERN